MNTLPIYAANLEEKEDGIYVISLVDCPATEIEMVCFNEDKPIQKFALQDVEKQLVYSVVMVADTPIYRRTSDGYEYNIIFSKDTINQMAEKMLKDCTQNTFSLHHNGVLLDENAISMRELFVLDREKGINPTFFKQVPDGSLIASLHIKDADLWKKCKNGEFGGISIEAILSFEQFNNKKKNNIFSMSKIKDLFKKLLTAFGAVETAEGTLHYDGDEDLKAGMEVYGEDGEVAKDGEYHTEDGKTIKVEGGIVAEIIDAEAEIADEEMEEEVEEPVADDVEDETVVEEPEYDVKAEIEALKAEIEAIKEMLKAPAVEPVEETFNAVTKKENKYTKLGEAMRNL